jgi:hypothetical protein
VTSLRWQVKGDYFLAVSPKAAAAAAVLIHQLSKENSQQPFSKAKGESQLACFHPTKPFLYVASQQHVRIYCTTESSRQWQRDSYPVADGSLRWTCTQLVIIL